MRAQIINGLHWRQRTGVALNVSIFPLWWQFSFERHSRSLVVCVGPLTVIATMYVPD